MPHCPCRQLLVWMTVTITRHEISHCLIPQYLWDPHLHLHHIHYCHPFSYCRWMKMMYLIWLHLWQIFDHPPPLLMLIDHMNVQVSWFNGQLAPFGTFIHIINMVFETIHGNQLVLKAMITGFACGQKIAVLYYHMMKPIFAVVVNALQFLLSPHSRNSLGVLQMLQSTLHTCIWHSTSYIVSCLKSLWNTGS